MQNVIGTNGRLLSIIFPSNFASAYKLIVTGAYLRRINIFIADTECL
jgi:hypothetical protein